jgi:hypothetical protein
MGWWLQNIHFKDFGRKFFAMNNLAWGRGAHAKTEGSPGQVFVK